MKALRKVLVVDDEIDLCSIVEDILKPECQVIKTVDPTSAVRLARSESPDLILLDLHLPDRSGVSICRELRNHEATRHIPIIMLTGDMTPTSRTEAFTAGADDYIAKPFTAPELIARVQSKLRRIEERDKSNQILECGNLKVDLVKMEVWIEGREISLSTLEFKLLRYLIEHTGEALSRTQILEAVWPNAVVTARTIDTHISMLRKRLDGFNWTIQTLYGAGYSLKPPHSNQPA